jgi:GntR family transcriptional regulator, arabinose operon transcriptional repressor
MGRGLLDLDLRHGEPGRSKHERLKDHFVKAMVAGRLKPGQALPSQRRLVEAFGVAPLTIYHAMVALENDGLIRRVQGKGNFVATDVRRKLGRGLDIFALVVPETRAALYPSLIYGFETAAGKIHHQTIVRSTDDDLDQQASIILQLLDRNVGGVAINPTDPQPTPAYQIHQLREHGIPVVFLHRRVEGIAAPLLAIPFYEVGRLAGKVLAEEGHQRVAYVDCLWTPASPVLFEGLNEGLRAAGCETSAERAVVSELSGGTSEEDVMRALRTVFARTSPPTAIFSSFDPLAETIYLVLPQLGLRAPEDVSLLGFGGARREGTLMRRLRSVVIDETAVGERAVALLSEMRSGKRPLDDNQEFVSELSVSEGQTVAPPALATHRAS